MKFKDLLMYRSRMLQRLKGKMFWKTQFDAEWQKASTSFNFIEFHYPARQKIREKKYLWREEQGKFFSPRLAAFKAYEDFCDEYFRDNRGRSGAESDFVNMGGALERAAPYIDEEGNYTEKNKILHDRWKTYAIKCRRAYEEEIQRREAQADKIASFNFSRSDVDDAWNDLVLGKIPETAASVWRVSYPRKSGHDIANEANATMQDFVFWMIVFREYLSMEEKIVSGIHMYVRNGDHSELSSAISNK